MGGLCLVLCRLGRSLGGGLWLVGGSAFFGWLHEFFGGGGVIKYTHLYRAMHVYPLNHYGYLEGFSGSGFFSGLCFKELGCYLICFRFQNRVLLLRIFYLQVEYIWSRFIWKTIFWVVSFLFILILFLILTNLKKSQK